jgi:hypothetical protein
VSDFGDFTDDDAFDTAPADAEQVARKLQRFRIDAGLDGTAWGALEPDERTRLVEVALRLLAWLRRAGATV